MTDTIIAALISAGVAILVCVLNSNANHKKLLADLEKRDSLLEYRMQQLEHKVEIHNQVVERTFNLEARADLTDEKLKVANHRIDDLEEAQKK